MSTLIGKTLGSYQFILKIKSTPIYDVYRVFNEKTGRLAAAQVIMPGYETPTGLYEKLQEHVQKLAGLNHASIAAVLDCDVYEKNICITYDFAPKRVFRRRFNHKMDYLETAQVLAPIAQALNYAHQHNLYHGYLQPDNIYIDEQGSPVIFGLGIEHVIMQAIIEATPGNWLGKHSSSFLAPEVAAGKPFDARADVYSVGMIFFECITGTRAFASDTPLQEFIVQCSGEIPKLKEIENLPDVVRQILFKALSREPESRFADMQHFSILLSKIALNQDVFKKNIKNPDYKPRKLPVRQLAALSVFSLTVILMIAAGLVIKTNGIPHQISQYIFTNTPTATLTPTALPTPTITATPTATATLAPTKTARPTRMPTNTTAPQPTRVSVLPVYYRTPLPYDSQRITVENAQRILTLGVWGIGKLNDIDWSADILGLATTTGIYLLDADIFNERIHIDENSWVSTLDLSPDAKFAAAGYSDGLVQVFDIDTGTLLGTLYGHGSQVTQVIFSPAGDLLASASYDGKIRVWQTATWEELMVIDASSLGINSLAFSPDSQVLASGGFDNNLALWQVKSGELIRKILVSAVIRSVNFSEDGKYIISAGSDSRVKIWDVDTGTLDLQLSGFSSDIISMKVSPDGQYIAACDYSGKIIVWTADGRELWRDTNQRMSRTLGQGYLYTNELEFSPDSRYLSSGIWDNTVVIWEASSGKRRSLLDNYSVFVNKIAVSHDDQYLAAETLDNSVWVFDVGRSTKLWQAPGALVQGNIFSNQNTELVIKVLQTDFASYDLKTGAQLRRYDGLVDIKSISYAPDSSFIASGTSNHIDVWSLDGKLIKTNARPVFDGCRGTGTSRNDAISTLYDYISFVNAGLTPLCNEVLVSWMDTVDFQNNGSIMVAGGLNHLEFWNYKTDSQRTNIAGASGLHITHVSVSNDGTMIAAADNDYIIHIWEVATGKELIYLVGHDLDITGLTFSNDGKYLFSSSLDGTIRVWGIY